MLIIDSIFNRRGRHTSYWLMSRYPVNIRFLYSFLRIGFASMASYFLLHTPQEVTKKEGARMPWPQIKPWGFPNYSPSLTRRSNSHPCSVELKITSL
jgi:hypothetical protein